MKKKTSKKGMAKMIDYGMNMDAKHPKKKFASKSKVKKLKKY